jgi:hypothetical protein
MNYGTQPPTEEQLKQRVFQEIPLIAIYTTEFSVSMARGKTTTDSGVNGLTLSERESTFSICPP